MFPDQAANPWVQMIPFVAVFFIFYFLVIKPEKEKQKKHRKSLNNLQKNDHVLFAGGIHGTVVNVKPTTVIVRVDDNARLEIEKESVTSIVNTKAKEGS